jgi:hypothetical protein
MESTAAANVRQPAAHAHGPGAWSRAARCRGRRRREPSLDAQHRSPDARLALSRLPPPRPHAQEREMHSCAHTCTRDQRVKAIAVGDSRTCGAEAQRCSIFASRKRPRTTTRKRHCDAATCKARRGVKHPHPLNNRLLCHRGDWLHSNAHLPNQVRWSARWRCRAGEGPFARAYCCPTTGPCLISSKKGINCTAQPSTPLA